MKYLFYHITLLMAVVLMMACSSDSDVPEQPQSNDDYVTLRIATATGMTTRTKTQSWADRNAEDEEMMNLWVVVVTNTSDGSVYKCFACRPAAGAEREIDDVGRIVKGEYTVYSFANISVANVCNLLGLTAQDSDPDISSTPVELVVTGKVTNAANKTATINGNGFVPTVTNNYGETGIPMSNVQTIAATESSKDLIVVRMLAKIELQLYNETGNTLTVKEVTLSDITANSDGNLKLLPLYTTASSANTMDVVHKDIRPNLNGTPTTTDYVYTVPTAQQTVSIAQYNNGNGTPAQKLTFYINESTTPTNGEGLFYLTLKMSDTEYRYALINQSGKTSDDDNAWNYIARNDYRIIPIVLDDYKLELIPYDFPPIGVYPVSVSEIDNVNHVYNFTFHDYGHFHLVPRVTKTSDNNSPVAYSATTPSGSTTAWTLNTDFAESLKTATTKGGTWLSAEGITANGFYRNQTATVDGDEAGGVPVWYANTSSPQWDPAGGTNYVPFIFGYIAEPPASWWETPVANRADRQIYHEFRVKLYVNGDYRRDLLYRFYMTLSKDQMLGARSAVPLPSEGNCTHSFPLPSEGRGRGGVIRRPHNHSRQ